MAVPVVVVVVEGRPADDEEVATGVVAPPGLGDGTGRGRELGARGVARGRRSIILLVFRMGMGEWFSLKGIPVGDFSIWKELSEREAIMRCGSERGKRMTSRFLESLFAKRNSTGSTKSVR